MASYNYYIDNCHILSESTDGSFPVAESEQIRLVLEDVNSPVTRKYQEKMFQAVMDKAHIDFGDIPKSAGNI